MAVLICISTSAAAQTNANTVATASTNTAAKTATNTVGRLPDPFAGVNATIAIKSNAIVQWKAQIAVLEARENEAAKRDELLDAAGQGGPSLRRDASDRRTTYQNQRGALQTKIGKAELEIYDLRRAYKIPEPTPDKPKSRNTKSK